MKNKKLEFQVRKATREDAATILGLVKELSVYERLSHKVRATAKLYEKYGFGQNNYFNTLLADVIENNQKHAVGFALYFFTFSTFEGKPTLYLEDLFVKPEYRGKGIGKRLLIDLANIATKKDCARMEWAVLDWNQPAIQFYESIGAKPMSDWTVFRLERSGIQNLADDE